jgi:hypothetical protein
VGVVRLVLGTRSWSAQRAGSAAAEARPLKTIVGRRLIMFVLARKSLDQAFSSKCLLEFPERLLDTLSLELNVL